MKSYEEKRKLLLDLVNRYLATVEGFKLFSNNGIIDTIGFGGNAFLIFIALTYSKEEVSSIYSIDFDIDDKVKSDFVNTEYQKIVGLAKNTIENGKIILDDSKNYYNKIYGDFDSSRIDDVAKALKDMGIKI